MMRVGNTNDLSRSQGTHRYTAHTNEEVMVYRKKGQRRRTGTDINVDKNLIPLVTLL